MLKLNNRVTLPINHFPDGTLLLDAEAFFDTKNYDLDDLNHVEIYWKFENNEEFLALGCYTMHLREHGFKHITLNMPYIPNARQDRVKTENDVHTLKYFAKAINLLGFDEVKVLDPHSAVSEGLINNIRIATPDKYVISAINDIHAYASERGFRIDPSDLTLFFPDEGAMKRYSNISKLMPYTFGIKDRVWKTGDIKGLDIAGNIEENIKNKNILIVDDISSKGGTFYHSALKLKSLGAQKVFLFVTHCENTIKDGELLKNNDLIERIYCTNSLITIEDEKIHVFNL